MEAGGLLDGEANRAYDVIGEGLLDLGGNLGTDLDTLDELDGELLEAARGSRGHQRGVQLDTL